MDLPTVALFLLIGLLEIVSVWFVNRRIKFEHDFMLERGTIGEQFGEWLMEKESEDEDAPTRLQALALIVGKTFFRTQRFSLQQVDSVESRRRNTVDSKIFEALKEGNPEVKIVSRILEEMGLGDLVNEKDLPYIMQKYGGQLGLGSTKQPSSAKDWKLNR